jgi:hypothetical protein
MDYAQSFEYLDSSVRLDRLWMLVSYLTYSSVALLSDLICLFKSCGPGHRGTEPEPVDGIDKYAHLFFFYFEYSESGF